MFEQVKQKSKTGTSTKLILCLCGVCNKQHKMMFRHVLKKDSRTTCKSCSKKEAALGNKNGKFGKGVSKGIGDKNPNWKGGKFKDYSLFAKKVHYLSSKQPLYILENSDKPRGRCGVQGAYQLDHIVPISVAYAQGWSVEKTSAINNLRFIPWEENLSKSNNFSKEYLS